MWGLDQTSLALAGARAHRDCEVFRPPSRWRAGRRQRPHGGAVSRLPPSVIVPGLVRACAELKPCAPQLGNSDAFGMHE